MKISDDEIIVGILSGKDDNVLNHLYQSCFPRVRRFVLSRQGSEADAQDIFQDAVMTFFTKVVNNKFDRKYKVEPFIIGVCKNLWVDKFRKDKRIKFVDEESQIDEVINNQYDYIFDQERAELVNEVLSTIGESCKEILIRVINQGMSMKEIAQELGYQSVDSAKTQHYKCRQKLIKKFKDNEYIKAILKGE